MSYNFEDRLDRLIKTSWAERVHDAPKQIGKMKADHAHRNVLQSSMTIQRLNEILCRELEARAILVWQAIVRVHKIVGVDKDVDLASYFKDIFAKYHQEALNTILHIFEKESQIMKMKSNIPSTLTETAKLSKEKHDIEIDLYVDSLRETDKEALPPRATYHFYGSVGAVQSGAGAYANIVQHLAESDKQEIINALNEVKLAVQTASDKDEREIHELVEVVDDSIIELGKSNPNNTKLRACFDVLSGSIQAIASAGPAYQALKNALLPLGIMLP